MYYSYFLNIDNIFKTIVSKQASLSLVLLLIICVSRKGGCYAQESTGMGEIHKGT